MQLHLLRLDASGLTARDSAWVGRGQGDETLHGRITRGRMKYTSLSPLEQYLDADAQCAGAGCRVHRQRLVRSLVCVSHLMVLRLGDRGWEQWRMPPRTVHLSSDRAPRRWGWVAADWGLGLCSMGAQLADEWLGASHQVCKGRITMRACQWDSKPLR